MKNRQSRFLPTVTWIRSKLQAAALAGGLISAAGPALAAGGKPATKLINVADTRFMPVGLSRWIAEVYNDNLWLYSVLVVVSMALIGLVLGFSFDRLVGLLGINLGKLDHHE